MAKKSEVPDQIIADLKAGVRHDLVALAVPSHGRDNKPLTNQDLWADETLKVFSDLYGGATAFKTFKGVYRSDRGVDLWDNPIMVESLADRERVENRDGLEKLLAFVRRMKVSMRQEAMLLVVNDCRRFL